MDWIIKMAIKTEPEKYKNAVAPEAVSSQVARWADMLTMDEQDIFVENTIRWLAGVPKATTKEGKHARERRKGTNQV